MKGIGIGESDFKMLLLRNNYFIDKSIYIKDIIDNQSVVNIITRPRRFGKTLNMSMLRYYFDIKEKDNKELFKGLKIMEQDEHYTSKLGYYPVIYMTLKDMQGSNFEEALLQLKTELVELFINYADLLKSEKLLDIEKEMFSTVLNLKANKVEIQNALKLLSRLLYKEYDRPVILLIDEYDVPLQTAYVKGYYDEAIDFLKTFYGVTFKDNPYLEKAVLTGVSRIAKESLFSGMNNFKVFTIMDNEFADDFGITSEEMKKIIKDFNVEDDEEEIKKWYDGYKIGNIEGIYNPWSILNYLTDKELKPYWVNTSSNDLIKMTLEKSSSLKEKMIRLLNDENIEVKINLETIIVGIENREENIWGLMLQTGYLKIEEVVDFLSRRYKVKFPNYEIKSLFEEIIDTWFDNKVMGNDLNDILNDLITLNLEEFEKKFKVLVEEMFSYFDIGKNTAENFYHAFVLGMLVGLKDSYYVNSNRESGFGRYDIMLEPKDKNANSFIIEFKVMDDFDEKTIEDTVENAKKQIEEKDYEQSLREKGFEKITKMVFAFNGKDVKMYAY